MLTTSSRARTLSLRAPIANESERALFQARLALTLATVFVLSFGFWLVQLVVVAIRASEHVPHLFTHTSAKVHLANTALALVGTLVVSRGKPSALALDIYDLVFVPLVCFGWGMMVACSEPGFPRAELIALLASSYTLTSRAALVPSTSARSGLIGTISLVPLIPITVLINAGPADTLDALAIGPAIYMAIWSAVGVVSNVTISHVIYELRLEVRKAMQLGQYLLEEKIGEGGMGIVYRASHAMLRRPTAIKLLTNTNVQAAERFEREVQITARLTHPNTIAIFDYGRTPDGVFYYAMEYLEGVSLEDLVDEDGPQPVARVVHVLLQMCGALEEAHAADLVHRDIKPANVMLTERGGVPDVVKILDFGLVKEEGTMQASPNVSAANVILGTPHYMAPEAILDPSTVDGRTDLYAVGATAYFLLTGERVFEGTNLVAICSQHLHEPPARASAKRPDVPPALEDLVLACLAKKPEDRPKDAADLAARLRACGVPEWTRAEARAQWERIAAKTKDSGKRRASKRGSTRTIAVDLDDRAAS